jgi:hypothetical protein
MWLGNTAEVIDMTIAELGSLGELIAALATLGTLIYLALQIRQNTASTKIAASQSILASLNQALHVASSTPQAARATILGQTDYEQLEESEQAQFIVWIFSWFRVLEQAHFYYERGYLENEIWSGQVEHLKQVIKGPSVSQWWEARRAFFRPSFVQLVEAAKVAETQASAPRTVIESIR